MRPKPSQQQLADSPGVSVGKANDSTRALAEMGLFKLANFRRSQNMLGFAYQLTLHSMAANAEIARRFLDIKKNEYEVLQKEVERPHREVGVQAAGMIERC